MQLTDLQPWDRLQKRITIAQLGTVSGKKILDFGSGTGFMADCYAKDNDVTAVEPSGQSVAERSRCNNYTQLVGSTDVIREMADRQFDLILCHNVLEYAEDREQIVRELARLLKDDGCISLIKHNRPGRVMQMAVLLDDFDSAGSLLDGNNGITSKFGEIKYYSDNDIEKWCPSLKIQKTMGIRTFFDLQQNQQKHPDEEWQEKMSALELRVSELDEYLGVAFFHHLILKKV